MFIRNCKNCNVVYQASLTGRLSKLCCACANDCESAFFKLCDVFYEFEAQGFQLEAHHFETLAEDAHIPAIFVWMLFHEGYFTQLYCLEDRRCKKCDCNISADKTRAVSLCDQCFLVLLDLKRDIQLHMDKVKDEKERIMNSMIREKGDNKYGFTRNITKKDMDKLWKL